MHHWNTSLPVELISLFALRCKWHVLGCTYGQWHRLINSHVIQHWKLAYSVSVKPVFVFTELWSPQLDGVDLRTNVYQTQGCCLTDPTVTSR